MQSEYEIKLSALQRERKAFADEKAAFARERTAFVKLKAAWLRSHQDKDKATDDASGASSANLNSLLDNAAVAEQARITAQVEAQLRAAQQQNALLQQQLKAAQVVIDATPTLCHRCHTYSFAFVSPFEGQWLLSLPRLFPCPRSVSLLTFGTVTPTASSKCCDLDIAAED